MLARILLLLAVLPACRDASARAESRATLNGTAAFPADLPTTRSGSVRMTVRGQAEINDSCKGEGSQQFVATYEGALNVDADGRFTVPLYPSNPTVVTSNGCIAVDIRIEQIASVTLDATLGDEVGHGELQFQNLSAVDGDELKAGAFDELNGSLTFTRQ